MRGKGNPEAPEPKGPQEARSSERGRETKLVESAIQGSQRACRELVTSYQRPVFSLIVRMVRDAGIAEDLTQETFVKAFRSLSSYDPRRRFASWLFKIAHNTTIDALRRKRLPIDSLDREVEDGLSPYEAIEDRSVSAPDLAPHRGDVSRALEQAIAQLKPEYREVLLLRFREELSYQEIAEVTDLPLGTVKTNIHRARKQMAQLLEGAGFGPRGRHETGRPGPS